MAEILIVAAHPPELAGLPLEVRRAAIGVGPVESAAGLAAVLAIGIPSGVILIGTCGAFSTALEIGDRVRLELTV